MEFVKIVLVPQEQGVATELGTFRSAKLIVNHGTITIHARPDNFVITDIVGHVSVYLEKNDAMAILCRFVLNLVKYGKIANLVKMVKYVR